MSRLDYGPVLNEHYQLSCEAERCIREHLHTNARDAARRLIAIADKAFGELHTLGTKGMQTSSGFIKAGDGKPGFHAGYDYMTEKGYMHGMCSASEAISLCKQAKNQKWWGDWDERITAINKHEQLLRLAKSIISETPGIIQATLLKQHPEIGATTLYYAEERGDIKRTKQGRSYSLSIPA